MFHHKWLYIKSPISGKTAISARTAPIVWPPPTAVPRAIKYLPHPPRLENTYPSSKTTFPEFLGTSLQTASAAFGGEPEKGVGVGSRGIYPSLRNCWPVTHKNLKHPSKLLAPLQQSITRVVVLSTVWMTRPRLRYGTFTVLTRHRHSKTDWSKL